VSVGSAFSDFFKCFLGQLQLLARKIVGSDVRDEHQAGKDGYSCISPVWTVSIHIFLFAACGAAVFASYWYGLLRRHWVKGTIGVVSSAVILWHVLEIMFPI
jgi:hypothetical protein